MFLNDLNSFYLKMAHLNLFYFFLFQNYRRILPIISVKWVNFSHQCNTNMARTDMIPFLPLHLTATLAFSFSQMKETHTFSQVQWAYTNEPTIRDRCWNECYALSLFLSLSGLSLPCNILMCVSDALFICDFRPHWHGLYGLSVAVISSALAHSQLSTNVNVDMTFSFWLQFCRLVFGLPLSRSLSFPMHTWVCVFVRAREKLWKAMHTHKCARSLTHLHTAT